MEVFEVCQCGRRPGCSWKPCGLKRNERALSQQHISACSLSSDTEPQKCLSFGNEMTVNTHALVEIDLLENVLRAQKTLTLKGAVGDNTEAMSKNVINAHHEPSKSSCNRYRCCLSLQAQGREHHRNPIVSTSSKLRSTLEEMRCVRNASSTALTISVCRSARHSQPFKSNNHY